MLRRFESLRGCSLAAADGEIGTVYEFYFDDQRWAVRYLVANTGSWLSSGLVLIKPEVLGTFDSDASAIRVYLTRDDVRHAPAAHSDLPVSAQQAELRRQKEELTMQTPAPWSAVWESLPPDSLLAIRRRAAATASSLPNRRQGDPHLRSSAELGGRYFLRLQDGRIGLVQDFIIDDKEWSVRYLVVRTGSWFFGKTILLTPDWIEGISVKTKEVVVDLPQIAIKTAPRYAPDLPITPLYDQQLRYFFLRKHRCNGIRERDRSPTQRTA